MLKNNVYEHPEAMQKKGSNRSIKILNTFVFVSFAIEAEASYKDMRVIKLEFCFSEFAMPCFIFSWYNLKCLVSNLMIAIRLDV